MPSYHKSITGLKPMNRQPQLSRKLSTLSTRTTVERKGRKKDQLERFIESPQTVIVSSLNQLRYTILCEALPNPCPYRAYIWSILLHAEPIDADYYVHLINRGESNVYDKIRNDAFRTFQNNKEFWDKINESMLVRVLNSYALEIEDSLEQKQRRKETFSPYVQGMNVLLAPMLFVSRSEPEAFSLFSRLLVHNVPRYVLPNLRGALDGVKLVDIILDIVDSKLNEYLKLKMLSAKIYALPSILTLSACTPQLSELLKLWDFLFSYGVHLNVFFVAAQVILCRNELLENKNPMSVLRKFPDLQADKIIKLSLSLVKNTPDDLYDLVVRHAFDESVSELIDNYKYFTP